ncbi:pentatricopeptide repeat-containing protein At5g66520-like [Humulus lupulus]|uniref:pentatricopeptide repeat-containing protein At5g66520-like n=1 Tax=Humulus lupulus TaxID=3486 RepID=UPI002B40FC12|nr:pentatricopeptide repeat-containing protein At5g66520-like [Humulus lupulus]
MVMLKYPCSICMYGADLQISQMLLQVDGLPKALSTISHSHPQNLFNLLERCNSIRKLTQIHTQILVNGFTKKNFLLVKLLFYYVYSGYLEPALTVFENVEKPSTGIWNQIIRGYGRSETPGKSVELYNRMVETEAKPDGYTYSFLLNACAKSGLFREGEQVHGRVFANGYCSNLFVQTNLVNFYAVGGGGNRVECARRAFDDMPERNVVSWNSLLKGYVKCGDIDGARRIFSEMPERNVVSWTTMVAGCAQNGKSRESLSLFQRMRRADMELDQVALVSALSACAVLGDLELGRWIHWGIEEASRVKNQPFLVSLNNALIHMYASCGVIDEAYEVFKKMPKRNTVSWTTIISGFAKQGRGDEALHVFWTMLSSGKREERPDEITFIGALCACSHGGLVNEGRHIFKFMTQTMGISPRIEHYGCMVDLLSRAGFLDEAMRLIETIPMKLNDAIWGALLGGCRLHKNAELASNIAKKLSVELNSDQAAGYLVLLSNVYAAAERWLDVAFVRQKMVQMGVKKPPGRSWIQIDGIIHDFVAGDMTHRHASSIYKMLDEIYKMNSRDMPLYAEEY